ncbi:hypothetical protein [Paenibacillus polymyxa]|uniref:hypothetical protein n=1 Tax=Paenibacillus polymyxa TaxID=1406 RepID=UPI003A5D1074
MKRFRKVISVALSSMLLLSFGLTANASASPEVKTDQAIQAVSNVLLTTDKESVIEQLTREDKPASITDSVYTITENINLATPQKSVLKKRVTPLLKASANSVSSKAAATASTATYSGTITEEGGSSLIVNGVVKTTDGQLVPNAPVTVVWLDKNWSESSGNRTRTASTYTDDSGKFSVTLSLPQRQGKM